MIFGIDPGPIQSAYAIVDNSDTCIDANKVNNSDLFALLRQQKGKDISVAIESIQSYGMAIGKTTIETCYIIGRFIQICEDINLNYQLIPRPEYAKSFCGTNSINDSIVRTAIENRFGKFEKGTHLFKLKGCSDKRSAFALAVYVHDRDKYINT